MRSLAHFVFSIGLAAAAHAQPFPVPVVPPQAVSPGDQIVTASLIKQTNVSIAAASNGYAVVWSEEGADPNSPGEFSNAYVRRFSAAGTPLDDAPSCSSLNLTDPAERL
jgi:hypothetical protein